MRLLLYRPRSESELRQRLCSEGYTPEETEEAIAYVSGFGYLNDRRFAENYARSQQMRTSRRVIRMDLEKRGVEASVIEAALEELDLPEEETLSCLLEKRAGSPHRLNEKEMRRVSGYLFRRGFAAGAVRRAIRDYEDRAEE